jgi:hypothetical protein
MSLSKLAAVAFRCSLAAACLATCDWWSAWILLHVGDGGED